jgi:lactoylglutathione lyase
LPDHRQNKDEDDGSDQTRQEDGAAKPRPENNLAAARLFSRIWLLLHDAAPESSPRFERRVGSALRGRLLLDFLKAGNNELAHPGRPRNMRYLHTMLRVRNLDAALKFYHDALGLKEVRRIDNDKGKFTLVFLCAPEDEGLLKASPPTRGAPLVELTYNWEEEKYGEDRYFGHLAYEVDDIYATCDRLMKLGITINRPPRDGQMAFVRSPDLHSIELLQKGNAKPPAEPWSSMPNTGHW